jgi:hypothetical protein
MDQVSRIVTTAITQGSCQDQTQARKKKKEKARERKSINYILRPVVVITIIKKRKKVQ